MTNLTTDPAPDQPLDQLRDLADRIDDAPDAVLREYIAGVARRVAGYSNNDAEQFADYWCMGERPF